MMGRVRMNLGGSWQGETLRDNLERRGVSRRDFMKLCGGLAAVFAFGSPERAPAAAAQELEESTNLIAERLGNVTKPNVAWLQLQECTGCMESVLRSGGTTVEDAVLDLLSVNYNELVMAASGEAAEHALHELNQQPHILVVNGSVSTAENGVYCTIGGKSSEDILLEAAEHASMILAVGACAVYGSVQAAKPNPTGAVGVDEIIKDKPVINVSGCPPIGEVMPRRKWMRKGAHCSPTTSAFTIPARAARISTPGSSCAPLMMPVPAAAGACMRWGARVPPPSVRVLSFSGI